MNYYYENTDDLFLDGEIFKDIEGYDGDYQVSNLGRIKSFKKYRETDVRILSQIKNGEEYLFVNLSKNGKGKPKQIHRLLFETFNNIKLEENECIHHINENPLNNILDNFKLMTISEHLSLHKSGENHHMYGKHHSEKTKELIREKFSGENHSNVKLKNGEVWLIKKILSSDYYKSGKILQEFIGKMFGVHESTISHIKNGRRWKHIL